MLLPIHVAAGGLAMILGAVALLAKKGGTLHRRSGMLFVFAMLAMSVSASILAIRIGRDAGNVFAAVITAYFVGTAVTTVRPVSTWTRTINGIALTVVTALAVMSIAGGISNFNAPGRAAGGVPHRTIAVMSLFLGTVMLLAAIGDLRVQRSGPLRGGPRLSRHLWRMCFALFIAAGSFFSIEERVARVLPDAFATGPMRLLPIVLVFGAMFYWLWRLRRRRPAPVVVRHEPASTGVLVGAK